MTGRYGEGPVSLGHLELPSWQEFMHYLYLPVRLPLFDGGSVEQNEVTLPPNLEFLRSACYDALDDALQTADMVDPYIYVTARRGFATPGNPLNRPGWHCDDFGGSDLNYIWSDVFPTRFLLSEEPLAIPADDAKSMECMTWLAHTATVPHYPATDGEPTLVIEDGPVNELLRLTPHVIHNTPMIPLGGGMRSFFKISVSSHRYDLLGNSHNYLLDYSWPMVDRSVLRNQPNGNKDYSGATP